MKDSARYAKIVEWAKEDHCCVGSAPGLIYGGAAATMKRRSLKSYAKPLKRRSISIAKKANRSHRPRFCRQDAANGLILGVPACTGKHLWFGGRYGWFSMVETVWEGSDWRFHTTGFGDCLMVPSRSGL